MSSRALSAPSYPQLAGAAVVLVAVLTLCACSSGSDASRATGGSETIPGPPLPGACQLVTRTDAEAALGEAVSGENVRDADRCRYVTEGGDEAEITVDRPGFSGALDAYRSLNPDAEQLEGLGNEAALRLGDGVAEVTFVKGPARFFIVINGQSVTRDALLRLARAAAGRL
jgi:hypothetical protein